MAQTTDYFGKSCGFVMYSEDDINYTDIGDVIDKVELSEQTTKSGEMYTQDGDGAIITSGKNESLEVAFTGVYSDSAAEGYALLKALRTCNSNIYLKWGPSYIDGKPMFVSGKAKFTTFQEPGLDAEDPVALAWGFKIKCQIITNETISLG